jgi:pilus assembly protein Flp/PilA
MKKLLARFRRDEEGAALIEYGLLIGLIAVLCIASITSIGTQIAAFFAAVAAAI